MTPLLERLKVSDVAAKPRAWSVTLDGEPLLYLSENHVAVNDLRSSQQYRWGFALRRNPWTERPRLHATDDAVHLFAGEERVGILRWSAERPGHAEVKVFDLDHRLLDLEVRYRQLPSPEVGPIAPAGLGL